MSMARLVLTALFVDRQSPVEVARRYGVHRSWVYKLKARYETDGDAASEPRSRRPLTSPTATDPAVVELIIGLRRRLAAAGLDAGPDTIGWHLAHHHRVEVSAIDDQPAPDQGRAGHPGTEEATQVLLRQVRRRAPERDLAVRLHPLPPHPS